MSKKRKVVKIRRRHAPGSPPGQVLPPIHAGNPVFNAVAFGPSEYIEKHDTDLNEIRRLRDAHPVVWIDIAEFGNADLILKIGKIFGLHRLALEDAINTHQRPKVEEYDDHLFLIARMLTDGISTETEQVAFFLGDGYVITFQERVGDCFGPIRDRIQHAKGRIRSHGADYLCYALIDSIVDAYFPVLEHYGELLEELEDRVVNDPHPSHVAALHNMKRDLLMLRRAIWPHREMINDLVRDEHRFIAADTRPFLRDCYDHTIQLMDIVETYREIASGLVDVHISSVSMKLNEVMKVLTIVATIFMPLSFIASLYGMNFDRSASPWNMPELGWTYGYPFALLLMAVSAGGLIWLSWRKGWLGNGK
jgi:magnesium transporter